MERTTGGEKPHEGASRGISAMQREVGIAASPI
jgi:hypothetical protein